MIHQYRNNGYNIVLDVNSGAIHVVDDVAYAVISMYQEHSRGEILSLLSSSHPRDKLEGAWDEVCQLERDGLLFTEDSYDAGAADPGRRPVVTKALCLHIAHGCNLACRYCFAGKGEYHGRRELMSFETGRRALDFLISHSGSRRNLEVDFFGGEPLLNWQVVKDLVAYGRRQENIHGKRFRFTLTTNGVLLNDEVMRFANREMSNVVLSLDGRGEVNDRMRPFPEGEGSYGIIVPKFRRFAESRGQDRYYVRGTYTRYNLNFSKDVLHLADLGFQQISVEPVVAAPSEDYAIRKGDLPILFREYDKLASEMVSREREGRGFCFFHFMIDLEGGPCVQKRLSGCGSATEYLAVTPSGELYPCHQFVGDEDFLMGDVARGVTRVDIQARFQGCNVSAKEGCRDCFSKFYCSGGCAANAHHFSGDIYGVYDVGCELQKKRVECAIMIKAAQTE